MTYKKEYLKYNQMTKKLEEISNNTYKCKCSHTMQIKYNEIYKICSYCKEIVFKDKKEEFIYKMKKKMEEK